MDGDRAPRSATTAPVARHAPSVQDPRRYRSPQSSTKASHVISSATIAARHNQSSSQSLEHSAQEPTQNGVTNGNAITDRPDAPLKPTPDERAAMARSFKAFVFMCMDQNERDLLQTSIDRQSKSEERMRSISRNHPGLFHLTDSLRESSNKTMEKLDASIKMQESTFQESLPEAIKSLQSALHNVPPSLVSDVTAKLEPDLEKFKAQLRAEVEAEYESKQAIFLEKLEAQNDKKEAIRAKKMEDDLAKFKEQVKAELQAAQQPSTNRPQDTVEGIDEMEADPARREQRSTDWYKEMFQKATRDLHELRVWKAEFVTTVLPETLKTLASEKACQAIQIKADAAIQRVELLETDMRTKFQNLNSGLDARFSTQSINVADLEKRLIDNANQLRLQNGSMLQNQNKRISQLEVDATTTSNSLKTLTERPQPPGDNLQMIQSLRQEMWTELGKLRHNAESTRNHVLARIQQCEEGNKQGNHTANIVETLGVAVRSLEIRYLNITTEDLFKHMVQAIKETYPWMESQHQEIGAIKERLTSLAGQIMTKIEFCKETDALKTDLAQEIEVLRIHTSLALKDLVKDVQELSSKFEKMDTTQVTQTGELVKRIDEHAILCDKFETQSSVVEELAEQISDFTQISGNFNRLVTEVEQLKNDLLRKHATSSPKFHANPEGFCSPRTVNMIIDQHFKDTLNPKFKHLMEVTNDLSKQWTDFKNREFSEDFGRPFQELSQPQRMGSRSEPERENETAPSPPVLSSTKELPGMSQTSATSQSTPTPRIFDNGSIQTPQVLRPMYKPSSSTTSGPSDDLLQIKGKAAQKENDSHSKPAQGQSLGSRITHSRPCLDTPGSSTPSESLPKANSPQAVPGRIQELSKRKKRHRKSSIFSEDPSGASFDTTSPGMSTASPAPSSSSDQARKKKRKSKNEHSSSQLK